MPDVSYLEVQNVTKRFGNFAAVNRVSFYIARGEFVCFLGPSGCGKTTLLRCIAGLEVQSEGTIRQDGRDISRLPPSRRDFGIVFQSYALFPNLTVAANIGFGLVNQRLPSVEVASRTAALIDVVGLNGHELKYPSQISGGQQQRVALARALATSPGLLLLDEPLSALDAKVRSRLRREIRAVQKRLGVTTIMVTHDQEEAQTMADRVLVMRDGGVEQIGRPEEIYDSPSTTFVADFIGVMNFLDGSVVGSSSVRCGGLTLSVGPVNLPTGARVMVAFRPEHVVLDVREPCANLVEGDVIAVEHLGPVRRVYLRTSEGSGEIRADVHGPMRAGLRVEKGGKLRIHL
ncbi:MAG: putative 2-aminoethylphosphonate ABC transporter ATP-binding protein, partial [Alphaproteobacteria bacterium]|nr:putative 2-aminoethylphosphonate ABC transporter ATP-binding protein [Alphaproteobacteria bacterium]